MPETSDHILAQDVAKRYARLLNIDPGERPRFGQEFAAFLVDSGMRWGMDVKHGWQKQTAEHPSGWAVIVCGEGEMTKGFRALIDPDEQTCEFVTLRFADAQD